MSWTKSSLGNPAALAVVAAILLMLGVLSLTKLPVQLFPSIEKGVVSVVTIWPGASPEEIESEISLPIEEVLRGMPGLEELKTFSPQNNSFMQLEFSLGTNMDKALLDLISRLNRVPPLPADSEPPTIVMGEFGSSDAALLEYFVQMLPGTPGNIMDHTKFVKDVVQPRLQSIPGVGQVDLSDESGQVRPKQLQITFDPQKVAEKGIDLGNITQTVGRSMDVSGGFVDVGRKQYTLRFQGKYEPQELASLILEWRDGKPVTLGDVSDISIGNPRRDQFIYQNSNPAIMMSVTKEAGANVLDTVEEMKRVAAELNEGVLKRRGLRMDYSFDPTVYIDRSISLLGANFFMGVIMAIGVLWWFLRQFRATLLIALTIPVSLLSTFVVLGIFDRTLNVISLAGLAFATGMVLDAAIVVLENIVRLREKGENHQDASLHGTQQVWGALLASTATTVAIFIPIMFLEDVEGQMFADLALTIAIGVSISLIVAVTILPTAAKYWLRRLPKVEESNVRWDKITDKIMSLTNTPKKRISWIAGLMIFSVATTTILMPKLNYLPPVKRDAVEAFLFFPPGSNVTFADEEIAQVVMDRLAPHLSGEKEPKIREYYMWSFPGAIGGLISVTAEDDKDIALLEATMQTDILANFPDLFSFVSRRSLTGGFMDSDSVEIEIQGTDMDTLRAASNVAVGTVFGTIPGAVANPFPDPNLIANQLRFDPDDRRLAEVGWTRQHLALVVRMLGDGLWLGEHFNGEERLDIYLKSKGFEDPELMANVPLFTPNGGVVVLDELAKMSRNIGPGMIMRQNGQRSMNVTVNPPPNTSLEELLGIIKQNIEPAIMSVSPDLRISYGGSAGDLERAVGTMGTNFFFALVLLFMIMAALFKSIRDSLLVIISIPLATVGGVVAIRIVDYLSFQPLDLLGMIGFIILLGLVVNNAILLVAQTRAGEENGLSREDSVRHALRLRLRPIFMSTLTSLFGMLPLLLVPGAGSVIYKGMAAAIVGGMSVSTVFTLILLPCLLQIEFKSIIRDSEAAKRYKEISEEPAE